MTARSRLSSADATLAAYADLAAHNVGEAVALLHASIALLESGRDRPGSAITDAMPSLLAGTERAHVFVDDLLGLTSVERGPVEIEDVDLAATLDEACEELGVALARSGARVRAAELPTVRMDPRQAKLALRHLVRVALAADAHVIDVSVAEPTAETTSIEVRDDGAPPPEGTEDQVFEPFSQIRGRGKLVGAGISLVLCRCIAEAHGGTIEIYRIGDGNTVTALTIPRGG